MSFGGSPGDIITAGTLALRAYRACKAAAGDFAEVTREVSAVSILVQDLEDQAASPDFTRFQSDAQKQAKLRSIIDSIIYALRELEDLATKYSSLSTARKNNWDRLRFASKSIEDIRARLILHTSAAQTILDGLTNRCVARIEGKTEENGATLSRIEQVLADIIKDIKHGSRGSSVVSDERWNIWTELKRELRTESYPVEVVQLHKDQIKQYLVALIQDADLQEEVVLGEDDSYALSNSNHDAQPLLRTKIQRLDSRFVVLLFVFLPFFVFLIFITIFIRGFVASPLLLSLAEEPLNKTWATPTPTNLPEPIPARETVISIKDQVTLELTADLFKNQHRIYFTCDNAYQAQEWIDQLSPLFSADTMDESSVQIKPFSPAANEEASRALQANIITSAARPLDASYCPRDPPRLDGRYWDIYSKESPCGHHHE